MFPARQGTGEGRPALLGEDLLLVHALGDGIRRKDGESTPVSPHRPEDGRRRWIGCRHFRHDQLADPRNPTPVMPPTHLIRLAEIADLPTTIGGSSGTPSLTALPMRQQQSIDGRRPEGSALAPLRALGFAPISRCVRRPRP
jgi:hypothetical protein